jgi:hypothetical protein
MSSWLEPLLAVILALVGAWMGAVSKRLPRQWWLVAFIPPFLVVALVLSVVFSGEWRFVLMAFVAALLLSTPLARLPKWKYRLPVGVFAAAIVCYMSVWPCLAAAASRNQLAALPTRLDGDGVCLQSTKYTCGPASAVTALRRLGLDAQEAELALLARTSRVTGTPADVLASVIQERYGRNGIEARYREFRDLAELKDAGLTLVVVKIGLLTDHWLTVLEVNDHEVVVADPLSGIERLPHERFLGQWRHVGVVVQRRG